MEPYSRRMPAGRATEELARLGIPSDEEIVVLRKQDMLDLMEEIRQEAIRRGVTEEILADILKDV
jgi:hypothetical protein